MTWCDVCRVLRIPMWVMVMVMLLEIQGGFTV